MENQIELRTNGKYRFWSFFGGALAGSLAGAAVMMLFAPQSGKRTRAKIQQKGAEVSEQITNTVDDALAKTRHIAHQMNVSARRQTKAIQHRGQTVLDDQKERLSHFVEAGKTAVQDVLS
jgi:gas vesicle protein